MNHYQSQKQNQQQKQGYYMSQQHLKLMHIMHLSGYALQEYIANEIELNPVLETETEQDPNSEEETGKEDEFEAELIWSDDEEPYEKSQKQTNESHYEAPVIQYNSLQENLKDQVHMMNLDEELTNVACYLVDELDDDGYLRRPVGEVADDYSFREGKVIAEERVNSALEVIQNCEPAGIGARNLHECLLLQLKRRGNKPDRIHNLSLSILRDHYNEFVQKHFPKIKSELQMTGEDLEKCMLYISRLSPKPVTDTNRYELLKEQIIPDFEVSVEDNELYVSLTSSEFIKLRVNPDYASTSSLNISNTSEKKQAENYFQNLVNDANSLINALKERETTMMKVMTAIAEMQPDFFKSGDPRELRPMILQDIANKTGYDLSTVSRITSNKLVQTPFGIFSLKNLFMRAISSEKSDATSSTSLQVQELIQQIVKEEDKQKPLSDSDIMLLLKEKEITIARRTVVKYRELSGIPNSEMRKKQQMSSM
ncbi:MAG: RNA polymerase factor sigma-54 [Bacteroidia bacterium]